MRDVYGGWTKGSHKAVATCNDCHTPHTSILAKYAVKGHQRRESQPGLHHRQLSPADPHHAMNREVAQHNCLYCHSNLVFDHQS